MTCEPPPSFPPRPRLGRLFLLGCAAAVVLLIAACGGQSSVTPLDAGGGLSASASLYIAMPADFALGETAEKDSGKRTQAALADALKSLPGPKRMAAFAQDFEAALRAAGAAETDYLIVAAVTDWYDGVTGWQPKPDRGEVLLTVYAVPDGGVLTSATLSCTGGGFAVNRIPVVTHGPEDCLARPLKEWRNQTFTRP